MSSKLIRNDFAHGCLRTPYGVILHSNVAKLRNTLEFFSACFCCTVHDNYQLQSCMVGFRMVSTFFIAFFSDFSRRGFVEN